MKGEKEMRILYLFGFFLYISICFSMVTVYKLIQNGSKGSVRLDWFISGLASWTPTLILSLFI